MCDGNISCEVIRIEPLHERWELVEGCAELLNTQWQRSMGARIHSLRQSSHSYPVCLLLLKGERQTQDEKLIGHARLSRVLGSHSLFVESVVVCTTLRGKGYGRILMEGVERYAKGRGCTRLCLTTHDKQHFYAHLGFVLSKPVQNVGTLASFMPMEVLHKFCRSAENEEEGRKSDANFNNPASPVPSILPHPPPPPPPLSSPPAPPISSPPAPPPPTPLSSPPAPPPPPPLSSPPAPPPPPPLSSPPAPPPPPPLSSPPAPPISSPPAPPPPTPLSSPPAPPPPPPLSSPPAPPPLPSCPPSSLAPVTQTLEQTPYTDNRGLPIFWMHKDI